MDTIIQERRTGLDRRKRIQLYKTIIIYGILIMTIFPIVTAVLMLDKVGKLESRLEVIMMKEQAQLEDSVGAFDNNPNATIDTETEEKEEPDEETTPANPATEKVVYLTFDDGPSFQTDEILDILAENDVKATFFVIGREDERYHEYYKRIVEEGHTLAMHSYSHKYDEIYASPIAFWEDLKQLQDFLYDITGERCTIYRFPGGSSNSVVPDILPYIECLNENGITYFDWNALNGDAVSEELTPEQLKNNVMNYVHKNDVSVVLMHDLQVRHATVESLQDLIDTLKAEGYTLLPIDENTPLIQHVTYQGES